MDLQENVAFTRSVQYRSEEPPKPSNFSHLGSDSLDLAQDQTQLIQNGVHSGRALATKFLKFINTNFLWIFQRYCYKPKRSSLLRIYVGKITGEMFCRLGQTLWLLQGPVNRDR